MRAGLTAANILIVSGFVAFSQSEKLPEFEVASVKFNPAGGPTNVATTPATLTMQNARARTAIAWAYQVQPPQISGPESLDAERYDIFAKASAPVEDDQLRLMLQRLLADRFRLAIHRSTREMQAYVMVVAKGGSKIQSSTGDAAADTIVPGKRAGLRGRTIGYLADHLADEFRQPVIDLTGLKGAYDLSLNITPYIAGDVKSEDLPAIVAQAMEEQLGIRLESRKTAVPMVFVDHFEAAPVGN